MDKISREENSGLDISVIMPALNEEDNIVGAINDVVKAFEEFNIKGEIIVVNDGSTDRTEELVRDYMSRSDTVRLIKHDKPHGYGASFWEGVDNARGNATIVLPGDNENDPWEIFRYYDLLKNVDIVIPFVFNKEVRPLYRNVISLIYLFIINITFIVTFNYTNGTILYRMSVLKKLKTRNTGFFFQTDILLRLVKKHYLYAEVPYRLDRREHGKSSAFSMPSLWSVMRSYLKLVKDYYFTGKNGKITLMSRDSMTFSRRRKLKNKK